MSNAAPYLEKAISMPAMPEVAHRLLRSFERDDLSLTELSSLVSKDQALAGKVLRLANSARYSPSRAIASVADATACLGLNTLRQLSLSACVTGAFPVVKGFDRKAFWQSNLAVATYAQTFSRQMELDQDMAFLGGLMLRSGEVLMLLVEPQAQAEVERDADLADSRLGLEAARLGFTHVQVTAALARHWRFPEPLCAAFDAAADPMATRPFSRLGAALRLASVLADAGRLGEPWRDALMRTQAELVEHLHLDLDWLQDKLPDYRLAIAGADDMLQ
jgi:HD-like signal output (HDOD) protein